MQTNHAAIPEPAIGMGTWRVWFTWLLFVVIITLAGSGISLHLWVNRGDMRETLSLVYIMACAATGMLIVVRRPANNIGRLLLGSAFCQTSGYVAAQYGLYGLVARPGTVPYPQLVAWSASILIPLGAALTMIALPLVFPDGRLVSPAWRPAARVASTTIVVLLAYNVVRPSSVQDISGLPKPMVLSLPPSWIFILDLVSIVAIFMLVFSSAASLIVRYRRARGDERLQLKWLTYAIFGWFISILVSTIVQQFSDQLYVLADMVVMVVMPMIPIAVGIAVLRHRLYDIDVLINRTLVYGVLTACVAGLYALVVVGLGALLQAQGSPAIGLAAAGVVALLFAPLRDRLQRSINRLLYGHRHEPYAALAGLGRRLEAALAPEEVLPIVVRTVAETLKLPYVAISLRTARKGAFLGHQPRLPADDGEVTASHGERPAALSPSQLVAVPLNYQGEEVGQLLLAPRRGDEAFSATDQRLVADLARQAGAAAHTVQLTRQLQASLDEVRRSRERLVTAQEEERRRIQRDLHDGLGPVLASIRLRLEACLDATQDGPTGLAAELERLHDLVGQASTDIRRLVYDLRPPALDQLGLVPALRQHVERFSRETGLVVQLSAEPMVLAAAVEVAIFRITQEALTNVHKHARASHVTIRLGGLGEALLLQICDDGVGRVGASRSAYGGTGVASMRERAELLGGALVIHSPPDEGTTVEAYLPLGRNSDE